MSFIINMEESSRADYVLNMNPKFALHNNNNNNNNIIIIRVRTEKLTHLVFVIRVHSHACVGILIFFNVYMHTIILL